MTTYEAYEHQLTRLTPEQKIQLSIKERNIGRELLPWEIVTVFHLNPSEEIKPRRRRMSDEVEENKHWDQE